MRLADFILANVEPILGEWEAFARSIWPSGAAAEPGELRDDAEGILRATVLDMHSEQTSAQQAEKSKGAGRTWDDGRGLTRASSSHGSGRVASGFDLWAVIAEYRALRASVLRLWRESDPAPDLRDVDDLTRFNESIDQSLTHAVRSYAHQVLEQVGAIVTAAGSVREAIEALDEACPDVLVSDLGMPDQDGFDLIRQVRDQGYDARNLPAVALTAFVQDDARLALLAGFQVHVSKPIDPHDLTSVIASLAGRTG